MTEYNFTVVETVLVTKLYTVEADTEAEAREKAENGETIAEEHPGRQDGVLHRDLWD